MLRHPWIKWYWADWRSDPRLRMCGLAARGLWAEMLALMQEATPYGHLLVNGVAPTDTQLAALAGAPSDQIPDLIRELESAGVFSRTRKSVIYSRRMIRDEKKAQTARENGKGGGNPTLGKQTQIPASDNPGDKPPDKPQTPEARDQTSPNASAFGEAPKRGSRLPDDWRIDPTWAGWAFDEHGFSAERIEIEAQKFGNYWHAKTGKDATKRDWFATWRNWILTAKERGNGRDRQASQSGRGDMLSGILASSTLAGTDV